MVVWSCKLIMMSFVLTTRWMIESRSYSRTSTYLVPTTYILCVLEYMQCSKNGKNSAIINVFTSCCSSVRNFFKKLVNFSLWSFPYCTFLSILKHLYEWLKSHNWSFIIIFTWPEQFGALKFDRSTRLNSPPPPDALP